jgi:hypothetical protein
MFDSFNIKIFNRFLTKFHNTCCLFEIEKENVIQIKEAKYNDKNVFII